MLKDILFLAAQLARVLALFFSIWALLYAYMLILP